LAVRLGVSDSFLLRLSFSDQARVIEQTAIASHERASRGEVCVVVSGK
jgi:GTP-dependent phosphoenolpyruvate carboxykinase